MAAVRQEAHAAPAPLAAGRQVKWRTYLARSWPLYVMVLIPLVQLAIFHYLPMYGVIIAFQDYNPGLGFAQSPWVGFKHFEYIFTNPGFLNVLSNTLIISLGKIITVQAVAITLALLLNEVRLTLFKRSIQTIVYLPHFLSWIVLGGILIDMLGTTGLVNRALGMVGIEPILFLGSNTWFRPMLIVTNLWKEAGWATIIYLAALTGIDPVLHEAAAIDGANRFQRIRHVNIPGIITVIILIACLDLGNVLQAGFEQILNLYNPAVYQTGDILDTFVYRAGLIGARYSMGAAVGLFKSVMGFILVIIAFKLANRFTGYRVF
jgi:putative aldouronate transport system permease protein